jgi:hypothetical protein
VSESSNARFANRSRNESDTSTRLPKSQQVSSCVRSVPCTQIRLGIRWADCRKSMSPLGKTGCQPCSCDVSISISVMNDTGMPWQRQRGEHRGRGNADKSIHRCLDGRPGCTGFTSASPVSFIFTPNRAGKFGYRKCDGMPLTLWLDSVGNVIVQPVTARSIASPAAGGVVCLSS